ncbi:MAG: radical SAM family heme chaperone HemW [Prevotella sp.]|nr:radical SAM family heme chaperone HemW [Prevotella sp.]
MAGLYIHIPFCKSRCIYCDFFSTVNSGMQYRYVNSLCREYEMRRHEILPQGASWNTIYIGGGTPSTLPIEHLRQLFATIAKDMAQTPREVTIECNPDDITAQYANELALLPINRVSMGAQTFDDNRLTFLHRRHSSAQIAQAVENLKRAGFSNISIDLMYGFPDETVDDFKRDIDKALLLDVPHISAYCLMYEEGTPLYRMLEQNKIMETPEETERKMYEALIDTMRHSGYEHYEISNFARDGYRSQHNSSYWNLTPYLGIGAAAHSFDGRATRSANPPHLIIYIEALERGELPAVREHLSPAESYNDYTMLRLRTAGGIDLDEMEVRFGHEMRTKTEHTARQFLSSGLLTHDGNRLRLTRQGVFVSNMVMTEFMIV